MRPTRRLATALMMAAAPLAGHPAAAQTSPSLQPDPLTRLGQVMKTNDITFIGDTAHEYPSIHGFVASPAFMKTARAAGVKLIGIEFNQYAQPAVDRYEAGKATPAQLLNDMKADYAALGMQLNPGIDATKYFANVANLIVNAKRENIKIVLMDNFQGQDTPRQDTYFNNVQSGYVKYETNPKNPFLSRQIFECDYDARNPRQYRAYYADLIQGRTSMATNNSILESALGRQAEKTVIFYGSAHLPEMMAIASRKKLTASAVNIFGSETASPPTPASTPDACAVMGRIRATVSVPLGNYAGINLADYQWQPAPLPLPTRVASNTSGPS